VSWLELVNDYGERIVVPTAWIQILGALPAGWYGKSVIA
jgi:hypothetical protein